MTYEDLEKEVVKEFYETISNVIGLYSVDSEKLKVFLSQATKKAWSSGYENCAEEIEGIDKRMIDREIKSERQAMIEIIEKYIERHKRHTVSQCVYCVGIIFELQYILKELEG